mgnify:CR=1 FL=1
MKHLQIASDFSMPLLAVTESFAIIGRRGSGKTHTAVVAVEEMCRAGVQVAVIDPTDAWWGLRVSRDGKKAGIPIYVFGGAHADAPLAPEAGALLADVVVDRGISVVLSLRHMSKAGQRRFVADFCERIYDRKGESDKRTPVHVFIDEADIFVPQRLERGAAFLTRCFGAVDTLVRRGRSSGLAPTLISQRPQVINKDVLSQTEILIAHQLSGPQDRKALDAWIQANDAQDKRDEFMSSLASLPKGTAWFWSPGMLKVFRKVTVRDRRTFDSSFTPKPGVKAVKPRVFAKVDLDQLTAEIASAIEEAKANDPAVLRKRIAELEKLLAKKPLKQAVKPVVTIKRTVLPTPFAKQFKACIEQIERAKDQLAKSAPMLAKIVADVRAGLLNETLGRSDTPALLDNVSSVPGPVMKVTPITDGYRVDPEEPAGAVRLKRGEHVLDEVPIRVSREPAELSAVRLGDSKVRIKSYGFTPSDSREDVELRDIAGVATYNKLPEGERKVLTAIAQYREGIDKSDLSVLTGYKRSSRDTYLSRLYQREAVRNNGTRLHVTETGLKLLGSAFEPLPTGSRLRAYWLNKLPEGEKRILVVLLQHRARGPVTRERLDELTGYKRSSRDTYLTRLASRQLVIRTSEGVMASDVLFDGGE